jgi:hypothetical protein
LQKLRPILLKPNKMTIIEKETKSCLSLKTSRLTSSNKTPIKTINTPPILWQQQPHFLVSQHFFSSAVFMMDFLSGLSVCVACDQ